MGHDFLNFCPRLQQMIDSGVSITKEGEQIPIKGASTLNNLHVIRELILQEQPKKTLEIGLAFGASALTILATMNELWRGEFNHTAIDPFQSSHWKGSAVKVIEEEKLSNFFTHCEEPSALVLPELVRRKETFDLIYVDGSHIFEDVFVDFYYSARLLNPGGIILFDDSTDKHVAKVVKFIKSNYRDILNPYPLVNFELKHRPIMKRIGKWLGFSQLVGFRKEQEPPRIWNAKFTNF